jgi:outer membrane protein assembly factor BamB
MSPLHRTTPDRRRRAILAVGLLALCLGFVAVPAAGENVTRTADEFTVSDSVVESDTPDPPSDRLGWENGVWANATLSVDQSDGITEAELEAVVARTMARVESVRGIEFDRTPPVRILFIEEHLSELDDGAFESVTQPSDAESTLLNQQYEALFLLDESEDAVEARRNLTTFVNGYYDTESRNVTMISADSTVRQIREGTLAQELFHAQQDTQFDLPETGGLSQGDTIEGRNTNNSYIEGDANYVQALYEQRCESEWADTCYRPGRVPFPDTSALNEDVSRLFQQPYNSGLAFVRDRHEDSGWAAVDELYEDPPASTEQVIHPEKYGADEPAELRITDQSNGAFQPLRVDGERATQSVGEPGLYVALLSPALETRGAEIIPASSHTSTEPGPPDLQFDHPITEGWDGDRLLPYVATSGNATGYVYETAWDGPTDAREFHAAYRRLLAYHGAEPVPEATNTYRLPEHSGFGGGLHVNRTGDRLRVVHAPSVDALADIRRGALSSEASEPTVPWERSEQRWELDTGQSVSVIQRSNGSLYLQSGDGNLSAVDRATGDLQWQRALDQRLLSAPVVSNESLYAVTSGPTVLALDAATGDRRWSQGVSDPIINRLVVADGTVYAGDTSGTVRAFDAATGTQEWATAASERPVPRPVVADGTVIVGASAGVVALDAATGEQAWRTEPDDTAFFGPTVADGTAYVPALGPGGQTVRIHALDTATGDRQWTRESAGTGRPSLTVDNDTVYAATVRRTPGGGVGSTPSTILSAIAAASGEQQWRVELNGSVDAAPVVSSGTVYAGTSTGELHAVVAATGERHWTETVAGAVDAPLVVADETLYVGDEGGSLSAFDATTGDRQWSFVADSLAGLTPTVAGDTVYASAESMLYAVEEATPGTDDPDDDSGSDDTPDDDGSGDDTPDDDSGSDDTPDDGSGDRSEANESAENDSSADGDGPGFGVLAVVGALVAAVVFARSVR